MTIKTSGPLYMSDIADELGIASAGLMLGDPRVRALAGKLSGPIYISDLYGTSNTISVSVPWSNSNDNEYTTTRVAEVVNAKISELIITGGSINVNKHSRYQSNTESAKFQLRINGSTVYELTLKSPGDTVLPRTEIPVDPSITSLVEIYYFNGDWERYSTDHSYGYPGKTEGSLFTYRPAPV